MLFWMSAPFKRLMKIHSNPPILYYDFNVSYCYHILSYLWYVRIKILTSSILINDTSFCVLWNVLQTEYRESEFTNLDFMDFWMRSIHAHTAENRRRPLEGTTLSPPIFIVGTHRNSLSPDPEEQMKMVSPKKYFLFEDVIQTHTLGGGGGGSNTPHSAPGFFFFFFLLLLALLMFGKCMKNCHTTMPAF